MKHYREKLKKQNIVLSVCIVILALCAVLPYAAEAGLISLAPIPMDSHWQSLWRGFVSGGSTGILGLMVFVLVRNLLAIKDDKKLKKLYVKTHDERTIQLFHNARSTAMSIFLIKGEDVFGALRLCASLGGDTDTIGALVGALCAAYAGGHNIPEDILHTVVERNHLDLEEVARKIEAAFWQ